MNAKVGMYSCFVGAQIASRAILPEELTHRRPKKFYQKNDGS